MRYYKKTYKVIKQVQGGVTFYNYCSYAARTHFKRNAESSRFKRENRGHSEQGKVSSRDSMQKHRWSLEKNTKGTDKM